MAVSKKVRFEVFKRDGFKCSYCGRTPPRVTLEVDHIDPKSNGGKDDINNLITACFDCNRGKSNIPLSKAPSKLSDNLEILKEQEDQLREYRKMVKKIEARQKKDIDDIDEIYRAQYEGWSFSDSFRDVSVKRFLQSLPKHEVETALRAAISKMPDDKDKVLKYFCGICWNKIRAATDPLYSTKLELKRYWESRPRGSGYIAKGYLEYWLEYYEAEAIKEAMNRANGIWSELKALLGIPE